MCSTPSWPPSPRAEDLLLQQKYSLMVCNSDKLADREQVWLHMLLGHSDGTILLPTGNRPAPSLLPGPVGQADRAYRSRAAGLGADCVLFDNESGAHQATTHLVALGHKRIGLLNLSSSLTPGTARPRLRARPEGRRPTLAARIDPGRQLPGAGGPGPGQPDPGPWHRLPRPSLLQQSPGAQRSAGTQAAPVAHAG